MNYRKLITSTDPKAICAFCGANTNECDEMYYYETLDRVVCSECYYSTDEFQDLVTDDSEEDD